jgi:hypothetical protein
LAHGNRVQKSVHPFDRLRAGCSAFSVQKNEHPQTICFELQAARRV